MGVFLLVVLIWLSMAVLTAYIAGKKNRHVFLWFGRGFALGIFALLYLLLLPDE